MIYVIRGVTDGLNFGYVKTREEAIHICDELPHMFKWEPLYDLETTEPDKINDKL